MKRFNPIYAESDEYQDDSAPKMSMEDLEVARDVLKNRGAKVSAWSGIRGWKKANVKSLDEFDQFIDGLGKNKIQSLALSDLSTGKTIFEWKNGEITACSRASAPARSVTQATTEIHTAQHFYSRKRDDHWELIFTDGHREKFKNQRDTWDRVAELGYKFAGKDHLARGWDQYYFKKVGIDESRWHNICNESQEADVSEWATYEGWSESLGELIEKLQYLEEQVGPDCPIYSFHGTTLEDGATIKVGDLGDGETSVAIGV